MRMYHKKRLRTARNKYQLQCEQKKEEERVRYTVHADEKKIVRKLRYVSQASKEKEARNLRYVSQASKEKEAHNLRYVSQASREKKARNLRYVSQASKEKEARNLRYSSQASKEKEARNLRYSSQTSKEKEVHNLRYSSQASKEKEARKARYISYSEKEKEARRARYMSHSEKEKEADKHHYSLHMHKRRSAMKSRYSRCRSSTLQMRQRAYYNDTKSRKASVLVRRAAQCMQKKAKRESSRALNSLSEPSQYTRELYVKTMKDNISSDASLKEKLVNTFYSCRCDVEKTNSESMANAVLSMAAWFPVFLTARLCTVISLTILYNGEGIINSFLIFLVNRQCHRFRLFQQFAIISGYICWFAVF